MIPATWSLAARLGAPALVLAAIAAAVWGYGRREHLAGKDVGRAEVAARWEAAKDQQRLVDEAERRRLQGITKEIEDGHNQTAARQRAAAAAARGELDRLRDAVAAARAEPATSDPDAAREPDAATAHDRVVLECAAELSAVAEHADAAEDQLAGLQAWVGRVCVAPSE